MGMNRPGKMARLAIADRISAVSPIFAPPPRRTALNRGGRPGQGFVCRNRTGSWSSMPTIRWCAAAPPDTAAARSRLRPAGGREGKASDFRATGIVVGRDGQSSFTLHFPGGAIAIDLTVAGRHNVTNALAAAALVGADAGEIAAGSGHFRAATKRMEMIKAPAGYGILNDTYRQPGLDGGPAHPRPDAGRCSGGYSGGCARTRRQRGGAVEVGRLAAECRVCLGLVGEFAGFTAEAAGVAGMAEEQVRVFADKEEAAAWNWSTWCGMENLASGLASGQGLAGAETGN